MCYVHNAFILHFIKRWTSRTMNFSLKIFLQDYGIKHFFQKKEETIRK